MSEETSIPISELSLAERIQQHDAAAEELFAETYRKGLYLMLLKRSGNPETANDLAQDSLLTALLALRNGNLREQEKLTGFVYGIAKNIFLRYLRAEGKKNPEVPLPPYLPHISASPDQLNSVRWTQIRPALERLDPTDQEILRLTIAEGLTLQEIADRLALNYAQVRQRKSRAVKKLAEFVKQLSQKHTNVRQTSREQLLNELHPKHRKRNN